MSGWARGMLGEQRKRIVANFHKFYADTAIYGNTSALMCGYAYFGVDHIVFGTDTPLGGNADSSGGYLCTQDTIESIEEMKIPDIDNLVQGRSCQGSSRVLRVSWLDSKLSVVVGPSRDGSLGVIGVSDMTSLSLLNISVY